MSERIHNPAARRMEIQRQLITAEAVSVEELSRLLGASVATIRRDLTVLEEEGLIRRTHGGAVVEAPRGADQEFALRERIDPEAKRAIAQAAMRQIEPDTTIIMNDGSTMLALAREILAARIRLTVVTPAVNVATLLSRSPSVAVYLLGGSLRHRTLGTSGSFAEQMLSAFNADIAMIAAEGITVENGLTYSYETDATLARLMHERASKTAVLATTRKLNRRDRITAMRAADIDLLITDCRQAATLHPYAAAGIEILQAEDPTLHSTKPTSAAE